MTTPLDQARDPHGPAVPPLRASDADRERTSEVLHEASAAGMLTLAEVEDRLALLYSARFRHELPPLVDDLPIGDRDPSRSGAGSVTDRVRLALTGLLALAATLFGLASRYHRVTAVVAVLTTVLVAALLASIGLEMVGLHEMDDH